VTSDPFAVLGLPRSATIDEVRAARRKLALELHPDAGGDERRMREVNAAFDAVIAHLTGRRPLPESPAPPSAGRPTEPAAARPDRARRPPPTRPTVDWRPRVQHDVPSFVIEALPAEAFEALLVVTSWIGEVIVDEPPYLLDVLLAEPHECWCRLELVPDAGASTVSLTVVGVEGRAAPDVEQVRDVWIAELNRLGADSPPS
jgi:hypothetical protein